MNSLRNLYDNELIKGYYKIPYKKTITLKFAMPNQKSSHHIIKFDASSRLKHYLQCIKDDVKKEFALSEKLLPMGIKISLMETVNPKPLCYPEVKQKWHFNYEMKLALFNKIYPQYYEDEVLGKMIEVKQEETYKLWRIENAINKLVKEGKYKTEVYESKITKWKKQQLLISDLNLKLYRYNGS